VSEVLKALPDSAGKAVPHSIDRFTNQPEAKDFIRTALAWTGSVTPRVLPRVFIAALYALGVCYAYRSFPSFSLPITPFEYSGAVLGLLLVLRINAGMDRWWEARKIWGSIVNQSRNLAIIGFAYSKDGDPVAARFLRWVAAWPHVMRESLRKEKGLKAVQNLLGSEETMRIRERDHMPTYVGVRIAKQLTELRQRGLDDFAFQRAERERALLIDNIGACERIRNTPIPYVLAVKIRRFILLLAILLPWALVARAGFFAPLVTALALYPLFSLDEIGAELQNPFSPRNLSHLPLTGICNTIESNVLEVETANR